MAYAFSKRPPSAFPTSSPPANTLPPVTERRVAGTEGKSPYEPKGSIIFWLIGAFSFRPRKPTRRLNPSQAHNLDFAPRRCREWHRSGVVCLPAPAGKPANWANALRNPLFGIAAGTQPRFCAKKRWDLVQNQGCVPWRASRQPRHMTAPSCNICATSRTS